MVALTQMNANKQLGEIAMTQTQREEVRDRGVTLAIEAAGGVGPLARKLGISQPSVSGWSRVPADRVAAVEAATGVARALLRPDLFGADQTPAAPDALAMARAREYMLLATLLFKPPSQKLLDELATLTGDPTPLGLAHIQLAEAAQRATEATAGREYFNLFIGVGRGELLPYLSFYQAGFLNERPLAHVREDLARLGVARRQGVFEPEDHIATLLEVMSGLAGGSIRGGAAEADAFFERHVKSWALRFFADLAVAESAGFYKAVAALGTAWIEIETQLLDIAA